MWPMGHVAIGYLLYAVSTRLRFDARPDSFSVIALAIGSVFPDLVDKPLAWYWGVLPTGRTLAHSLLVLGPLVVLVYVLARRYDRGELGVAFGIGAISHPLVDALPALWGGTDPGFLLWPLVPVEPYQDGAPTILSLLSRQLTEPYFLLEFVLLSIAFILWRRDSYPGVEVFRQTLRRAFRRPR